MVALVVINILVTALSIYFMWRWFIVPLLDVKAMNIPTALGIVFALSILRFPYIDPLMKVPTEEELNLMALNYVGHYEDKIKTNLTYLILGGILSFLV